MLSLCVLLQGWCSGEGEQLQRRQESSAALVGTEDRPPVEHTGQDNTGDTGVMGKGTANVFI